jgi:site-specific recombinase XerD
MKRPNELSSSLAERIVQFIAFKRMQGHAYEGGADELKRFDAFLTRSGYAGKVLQLDVLEHFAEDIAGLSHSARMAKLSTVRQFSLYLHALAPESVLLPPRLVPRAPRAIRFYPLSSAQVGELMAATTILEPDHGIRAECIRFLIGLLYCTGLRISEAVALNVDDVNRTDSMLFVRGGKLRKERLVPMSRSTRQAVDQWLARRAEYAGSEPCAPLLVTGWNKRLSRYGASHVFRRLCIHCGLEEEPPPRLHDLRHNYACACLARWRQAHEDVDALLPVLANAMGHADFRDTEIYLHHHAAGLQSASQRFEEHVQNNLEHQQ